MKFPRKIPAAIRRIHILMLLSGVFSFLLLWQLSSLFPQNTIRILVPSLLALVITLLSRRLFRTRQIGLRTLVLFAPLGMAAICFPCTYVIENRRMAARLEQAGVSRYHVEPNGKMAEALGGFCELLFDYRVSMLFRTELRTLHLSLSKVQEEELASIPANHLMAVSVAAPKTQLLTQGIIAWLNDLPSDCHLSLTLFGLEDESAQHLDKLEHDVHTLYVHDQILSKKALHSILNLAPSELSLRGIELFTNDSFVGAPVANVELLRVSRNYLSDSDFVRILNLTNPKTLILSDTPLITPKVFASIAALQRLEGLSTAVPWLTMQHVESLQMSETLQWGAFHRTRIQEEEFEILRAASPAIKINGKSASPR